MNELAAKLSGSVRDLTNVSNAQENTGALPIQMDFSTMRRSSGGPSATKVRREKGILNRLLRHPKKPQTLFKSTFIKGLYDF